MVADRNPHKQSKFLPGTHIPVVSPEELMRATPDYVLILPWNLQEEIMRQLAGIRDWGGRFVTAGAGGEDSSDDFHRVDPARRLHDRDGSRAQDERGFFARSFCAEEFAAHGLPAEMPQMQRVLQRCARARCAACIIRRAPHDEDKLVRCTAGAIFDVIVDLRGDSPTRRRWFGTELTADNRRALFVPQGFAHGFVTLRDETEVFYMISVPHVPGAERGLRWNDPAFAIEWPIEPVVISARDAALSAARRIDGRLSAKKRVLVTGAGGFIGRWSIEPLRAAGYEVHAVFSNKVRSPRVDPAAAAAVPTRAHRADLLEPQAIDSLIEAIRPTHLLHFAWIATPGLYWNSAENYRWLAASHHLLRSFHAGGGVRAVMAGSCAEYDWSRVGDLRRAQQSAGGMRPARR